MYSAVMQDFHYTRMMPLVSTPTSIMVVITLPLLRNWPARVTVKKQNIHIPGAKGAKGAKALLLERKRRGEPGAKRGEF
jgi:hypothetical protein